jgi:hypothetical protein
MVATGMEIATTMGPGADSGNPVVLQPPLQTPVSARFFALPLPLSFIGNRAGK